MIASLDELNTMLSDRSRSQDEANITLVLTRSLLDASLTKLTKTQKHLSNELDETRIELENTRRQELDKIKLMLRYWVQNRLNYTNLSMNLKTQSKTEMKPLPNLQQQSKRLIQRRLDSINPAVTTNSSGDTTPFTMARTIIVQWPLRTIQFPR